VDWLCSITNETVKPQAIRQNLIHMDTVRRLAAKPLAGVPTFPRSTLPGRQGSLGEGYKLKALQHPIQDMQHVFFDPELLETGLPQSPGAEKYLLWAG
jgi:hypothetical protein